MKRKMMPSKGAKKPPMPKMFNAGPKKPEADDKPGKAQKMTKHALAKRLEGRAI